MRGVVLLSLVAVAVFATAYINHWAPFSHEVPRADASITTAPIAASNAVAAASADNAGCKAYSVFVDPTSSTKDRVNYSPEMGKFLAGLHECDSVKVARIADRTADDAAVLPWTELPVRDPEAGLDGDTVFKLRYQKAKRAIADAVNALLQEESPALSTDVLGILTRLSPDAKKTNVLVVASDGLDSATIENACINRQSIQGLLDKAAERLRGYNASLAGFSEVFWVLPTKAGRTGCNSLREQRLFWPKILEAEAAPGKLAIHFDTNPL